MKAVVQRVSRAQVTVEGQVVAKIGRGLLTLLAVEKNDEWSEIEQLIQRIVQMRVFSDSAGKMNLDLKTVQGSHLIVSQFTLAASWKSGRRPSFDQAESPQRAKELFDRFVQFSKSLGIDTQCGVFAADMQVLIENDGPVTFVF